MVSVDTLVPVGDNDRVSRRFPKRLAYSSVSGPGRRIAYAAIPNLAWKMAAVRQRKASCLAIRCGQTVERQQTQRVSRRYNPGSFSGSRSM